LLRPLAKPGGGRAAARLPVRSFDDVFGVPLRPACPLAKSGTRAGDRIAKAPRVWARLNNPGRFAYFKTD
jgi:hypothetical protein